WAKHHAERSRRRTLPGRRRAAAVAARPARPRRRRHRMTPRSAWLQPLLPLAAPVPVAALAAAAGVLSTNAMVAVAIAAAVCLSGPSAAELLRAQPRRDDADRWILGHAGARPGDELIE